MKELKKYLTINGVFSVVCGASMLLFSGPLNSLFEINNQYVFPIIGVNLLLFGSFVIYVSRQYLGNKTLVNIISNLDALWVFGSLAIILFGLFELSNAGNLLVGIVAIWIAFLGYKQFNLKYALENLFRLQNCFKTARFTHLSQLTIAMLCLVLLSVCFIAF